jgi:hypothetical protein
MRLLDKCMANRVAASESSFTVFALEAFKVMNVSQQTMREENARLREDNAALKREIGAPRDG